MRKTIVVLGILGSVACGGKSGAESGGGEEEPVGVDAGAEDRDAGDVARDAAPDVIAESDAGELDAADAGSDPCFCGWGSAVCAPGQCGTSALMCESNPFVFVRDENGKAHHVPASECARVGDVMCCPHY